MAKMQKFNLRMQKLNFPGTHVRGLALIGAQKNPCSSTLNWRPLLVEICHEYCIVIDETKILSWTEIKYGLS